MLLRFVPVPAASLPAGVHVAIVEGELEAVYLMSEGATFGQTCEALTELTNAYAATSWLHVGNTADFEMHA